MTAVQITAANIFAFISRISARPLSKILALLSVRYFFRFVGLRLACNKNDSRGDDQNDQTNCIRVIHGIRSHGCTWCARVKTGLKKAYRDDRQVIEIVWLPGLDSNQRPFD